MHHIPRVHDARRRRPQKPTLNSLRNPTEAVSSAPQRQPTFKETIMSKLSTFAAYPAIAAIALASAFSAQAQSINDPADQAAYGAMPAASLSLRTRAEVRAEAIAARNTGFDANYSEGGDPQHAALIRAKHVDGAHLLAAASAKSAK